MSVSYFSSTPTHTSFLITSCSKISHQQPLSCCFKKKKEKKNWIRGLLVHFTQWTKLVCFALTRLDLLPVCEWNTHQHNVMWLHSVAAAAEAAKKEVLDIQRRAVQIFGFWGLGRGKENSFFFFFWECFHFGMISFSSVFCIKLKKKISFGLNKTHHLTNRRSHLFLNLNSLKIQFSYFLCKFKAKTWYT